MSERNPTRRRQRRRPQDTQPPFELSRRMYSLSNHPLFERNLMGTILEYADPIFQELLLKVHNNDIKWENILYYVNQTNRTVYPAQQLREFFPVFPPQLQNILEDIVIHFTEDPPNLQLNQGRALSAVFKRLSKKSNFEPELMKSIRRHVRRGSTLRTVLGMPLLEVTELIFSEDWQNELVELYERLFRWIETEGVRLNPQLNEYIAVFRDRVERQENDFRESTLIALRRRGLLAEAEELEAEVYISPITDEEVIYMSGRGAEFLIYDIQQHLKLFFEALSRITPDDIFSESDSPL